MTDREKTVVGDVKRKLSLPPSVKALLTKIWHNKQTRLILIGMFLVLVLAGGYALFSRHAELAKTPGTACTNNPNGVLKEAAKFLEPSKSADLKKTINKIQTIKGYEKDPNCLNPIVTYYINVSDYQNAKFYMDMLEKRYATNSSFSNQLGSGVKNIATLRSDIAFLKKVVESKQKNNNRTKVLWTTE